MATFNQFPVFAANQVLRHDHLNDLINYLDEQDRLTRLATIGIGIVGGFHPKILATEEGTIILTISEGVGITSQGHMITSLRQRFSTYRRYTATSEFSNLETDIQNERSHTDQIYLYRELAEVYPFFKNADNNELLELYELLPTDEIEAEDTEALTKRFLQDKVLLAYLKLDLQSLKNCDTNDCSDLGAFLERSIRFLLAPRNVADSIKEREASQVKVGSAPIHTDRHPRYKLQGRTPLLLRKIDVNNVSGLATLANRYRNAAREGLQSLRANVVESLHTYQYLLREYYPNNITELYQQYFDTLLQQLTTIGDKEPMVGQYFYDFAGLLIDAFHEFIHRAATYDARSNPSQDFFPKHLMLGSLANSRTYLEETPPTLSPNFDFGINNDLSGNLLIPFPEFNIETPTGNRIIESPTNVEDADLSNDNLFNRFFSSVSIPSISFVPTPASENTYRHTFIPAHELQRQQYLVEELWTLHHRLLRMLQQFDPSVVLNLSGLKVIPSRSKIVPLSQRAIPAYLPVSANVNNTSDTLLRLWSYRKTRENQLNQVYSYYRLQNNNHPLSFRQTDTDFYRIEGHISKYFNEISLLLSGEQQRLGLDFGVRILQFESSQNSTTSKATRFDSFVRQHPGIEHQGGVPKGGTFVLVIDLRGKVIADFALPYNCCQNEEANYPVEACEYKWISSAKYLRNIARPKKDVPITERSYKLAISKYQIEGAELVKGGRSRTVSVPIKELKVYGMRAIADYLNQAFPTGLVFDTTKREDYITIKKFAGQQFQLEISEVGNRDKYLFDKDGRKKLNTGNNPNYYKAAQCRMVGPRYQQSSYEQLHGELWQNSDYHLDFMINSDWQQWNGFLEDRLITMSSSRELEPIRTPLRSLKNDIITVSQRAKLYLVGDWVDGSWVSEDTINNEDDERFIKIREKLLGKSGPSDLDVLVELPQRDQAIEDAILATVQNYYGKYRANVKFGTPRGNQAKLEVD